MISLIHPSRGRSYKAFETAKEWVYSCGRWPEYICSIDKDDPSRERYYEVFTVGGRENPMFRNEGVIYVNENKSVVDATNKAAELSKGDILLYLSDDFACFKDWGIAIEKEFEGLTEPMLLKVDDCLQKFHVPVLTIPIMNRALYEKLGYFWNPLYKSMFVDEDLYWTCHKLNCIKYAPHLKFPHNHVSIGKAQDDETYRRSAANWNQGKEVFARRKAQGFPL